MSEAQGPPKLVRLGDKNLIRPDDGAEPAEYKIQKILKHPRFKRRTLENDIGLIKLNKIVIFTEFIRPACLYQKSILRNNTEVIAVKKMFEKSILINLKLGKIVDWLG